MTRRDANEKIRASNEYNAQEISVITIIKLATLSRNDQDQARRSSCVESKMCRNHPRGHQSGIYNNDQKNSLCGVYSFSWKY